MGAVEHSTKQEGRCRVHVTRGEKVQGTRYKRREGMEQVQLVAWSRHSVRYVRGRATCTYVQCTHVQSGTVH